MVTAGAFNSTLNQLAGASLTMDLTLNDKESAFQTQVRAFIAEHLPAHIKRKVEDGLQLVKEDYVSWQKILYERGWMAPNWPKEYGGTGWTPIERYLFEEELALASAPRIIPFGVAMVGPVIIEFGSEAQKQRFLPRILSSEDLWCQGYSEPSAGSDLASLTSRARRDGECYIVNGAKTWTTMAHYADWIFCLVRTDSAAKKQEGISFLLIDMRSPGVSVRPIRWRGDQRGLLRRRARAGGKPHRRRKQGLDLRQVSAGARAHRYCRRGALKETVGAGESAGGAGVV
jgi:alkylation response protein AidB-like acyl-CoA dehydrogenase